MIYIQVMATIIFDLDYTLLNSDTIKKEIGALFKELGIPEKKIDHAYKVHRKNLGGRTGIFEHIEELKKNGYDVPDKVAKSYLSSSMKHHLFEDVEKILKKLKSGGHRLIILTLGLDYFQKFKIKKSGIKKFFEKNIYVCEEKNKETIERIKLTDEKIYFINDNSEETLRVHKIFPEFTCIIVKSFKTKVETLRKHKKIHIVENIIETLKYIK